MGYTFGLARSRDLLLDCRVLHAKAITVGYAFGLARVGGTCSSLTNASWLCFVHTFISCCTAESVAYFPSVCRCVANTESSSRSRLAYSDLHTV